MVIHSIDFDLVTAKPNYASIQQVGRMARSFHSQHL